MHIVTFIVALIFCVAAAVLSGYALVRLARNDKRARGILETGFGLWLFGIVLSAILFGFFSL